MSLDSLKKAVVLAPKDAEARFRLAEGFYAAGKLDDAQKQLGKLFALDPAHAAGRGLEKKLAASVSEDGAGGDDWQRAQGFAQRDRYDDAVLYGERAAKTAHQHAELGKWCSRIALYDRALLHLGDALLQHGGHHGGWDDFKQRLIDRLGETEPVELFTETPAGRVREALRHVLDGDVVAAKRALATVSAAEKATPGFHRVRGEIWLSEGDTKRAATAFEAAAKLDPRGYHQGRLASHLESRRPGRLGALAWTEVGGAVTMMEAVAVMGRGTLCFTGKVGDALRDSCQVAYTALRAASEKYQLDGLISSVDLHLNFTSQAKTDGSSAGLALALAGYSALKKKPLQPHLATTGALNLHGEVQRIDGVYEKAVSARLHGIRRVLHPKGNTPDVKALPSLVTEKVEFIAVRTLDEALQHAFP